MRTPNTQCILCGKPLYRRPYELAKTRYAACMKCRSEAQKAAGITEKQQVGLSLGRQKGTNHRTGYKHREESKRKTSEANKRFWADNPEKAKERGAHNRGEKNRLWKGGISRLNTSIRQMTENRRWMDAIKDRDGCCQKCGSTENLEAHHEPPISELIERLGIKSRDDARNHADVLWSMAGGATLCQTCHYEAHGRTAPPIDGNSGKVIRIPKTCKACGKGFTCRPSRSSSRKFCSRECRERTPRPQAGPANPHWKGGLATLICTHCFCEYQVKRVKADASKFCSRECVNDHRRRDVRPAAGAPEGPVRKAA